MHRVKPPGASASRIQQHHIELLFVDQRQRLHQLSGVRDFELIRPYLRRMRAQNLDDLRIVFNKKYSKWLLLPYLGLLRGRLIAA